ncbi:related to Pdr3p [Cephalotrichum gorgonifer]|uniref:Related to Pdr3p n=1 Tax=Cephalotrichum gorgonifer TaxID=2041049 RepID=A0AAE8SWI6_9PEZI|nr:related to Pdr3p [Cephalotrichum gorgonifer]
MLGGADDRVSRPQRRKRSKLACEPCRDLKRKCDGSQPCGACVRFEYDCIYQKASGKRKRTDQPSGQAASPAASAQLDAPRRRHPTDVATGIRAASAETLPGSLRSLEANSGSAFLRRLALRLDPKNAPRMHTFAWNAFLGSRKTTQAPVSRPIMEMLSQADMESLSSVYFEKLHPIYGFLDAEDLHVLIKCRWAAGHHQQPQDPVLCGIAALGCLFSQIQVTTVELDLVESARSVLEQTISDVPSTTSVTAWLLRVVYLRIAGTHHAAWMASCILMHMVEAAGLHCEPSDESVLASARGEEVEPEFRRRLMAVAQHLNIWLSFDMGRSRITLCNLSTVMPSERKGDYTCEIMELLPYSEQLDPEKAPEAADLESALTAVLARVHSVPPSILAQYNLALCLCRRLQAMNVSFAGKMLDQILALTSKGIEAAQAILDARSPWHHMANVPFQTVCLLLAIDNFSSMSQLKDAMQCLSNIATVYDTDATREAFNTASLLIRLHQRWKEKGASELDNILKSFPIVPRQATVNNEPPSQQLEDTTWLDGLAGEFYNLDYSDIDQILFSTFS